MIGTILNFVFLIIGFVLLIKGADYMVEGSSSLAKRLSVSELVIGLTIISFGTSAPELVVNIISALKESNGLVFGNVIGSNLFNILLVLGVAGVISPIKVRQSTIWKEIPFAFLGAVTLFVLVNDALFENGSEPGSLIANKLSHGDGIILLSFFLIFVAYVFAISKENTDVEENIKVLSMPKVILFTGGGLVALVVGGNVVVSNAVSIAKEFGVSEKLIGLTVVAAGTSLPELATTGMASLRGKSDIAIGNIIGSNIFNIFLILGISSTIHPTMYDLALNSDLIVMIIASLLVFVFMFTGKKKGLNRLEAIIFLVIFTGYMAYVIFRG